MTTAAKPAWQITPEKVQAVVQRLIQIGRPKKIILAIGLRTLNLE
jgi:hypothetical protein